MIGVRVSNQNTVETGILQLRQIRQLISRFKPDPAVDKKSRFARLDKDTGSTDAPGAAQKADSQRVLIHVARFPLFLISLVFTNKNIPRVMDAVDAKMSRGTGPSEIKVPAEFELLRCFSVFDTAEDRAGPYVEYTTEWSVAQVNGWFNSALEQTELPQTDRKISQGIEISIEEQDNRRVLTGRLCSGSATNYIEFYESKL